MIVDFANKKNSKIAQTEPTQKRAIRRQAKKKDAQPKPAPKEQTEYKASLLFYLDRFIRENTNVYRKETIKRYQTLHVLIKGYQEHSKTVFTFESVNIDWGNRFIDFLINVRNNQNEAMHKVKVCLFKFLRYYSERGFIFNQSIFKLTVKQLNKLDFPIITESELTKLIETKVPPILEKYKDLFLFQLFTGQRISDVKAFRKEQVKNLIWEFYAEKTSKLTKVPLSGFGAYALVILKKYDYNLPSFTEQHLNKNIKEICRIAGIDEPFTFQRLQGARVITTTKPKWELITTHTARRSCISLLISKGIPLPTIMKLTGHSDVRMLMKYEQNQFDALEKAFQNIKL